MTQAASSRLSRFRIPPLLLLLAGFWLTFLATSSGGFESSDAELRLAFRMHLMHRFVALAVSGTLLVLTALLMGRAFRQWRRAPPAHEGGELSLAADVPPSRH